MDIKMTITYKRRHTVRAFVPVLGDPFNSTQGASLDSAACRRREHQDPQTDHITQLRAAVSTGGVF